MQRILFFIESLQCGGAEKSLLSLLNALNYDTYEVTLMVLRKGGEFEKLVPKHIQIKSVNYKAGILERIHFKTKRFLDAKNKFHRAQLFWQSVKNKIPHINTEYDIAISWGQGFATYFVAEKVKAIKKYAWVNTDYENAGYNAKRDICIYRKFDKIVGVSDFVKQLMQKLFINNEVISIRNIIDAEEIKTRAKEKKAIVFDSDIINIVTVGRLVKYKGFELSIGACKILIDQGYKIHLYILGEGIERTFLEEEISKYDLESSCSLLGFNDNPYPYINDCDIYLQSSKLEGLGRTVIEAGVLCKPMVITNFATASSLLTHEKTGLITDMTSNDIASAIRRIIVDGKLKKYLVNNLKKKDDNEKEKTLSKVYDLFNF